MISEGVIMAMDEDKITAETQPKEYEGTKDPIRIENPDYLGKVKLKEWRPLYEHFKLEESINNDKALSKIWAWARSQAQDQKTNSILWEVIKLDHKLGSAGLGNNVYSKIENYITVWNQFHESEKLLKEMEMKTK